MVAFPLKLTLLLFFGIVYVAARQNITDEIGSFRIVGGIRTRIEAQPYQVALYTTNGPKAAFFCGGSIISSQWVLTAAHCCLGATNLIVKAGDANICTGVFIGESDEIHMHPDYDSRNFNNDICLLKMKNDIPINGVSMDPVILANEDEVIYDAEPVRVTGWGTTSSGGRGVCNLLGVNLQIINKSQCEKAYSMPLKSHICAGMENGGKDACQGDSGGPLVTRTKPKKQIGVVSFGIGCAQAEFPGAYTSIPYLRKWITSVSGI